MHQVTAHRFDFLIERHALFGIAVERIAQETGQRADHAVGLVAAAIEHERRDRVQRIEEEMRIQLIAQHAQLRLVRHRGCVQRRFLLVLELARELDADVRGGPREEEIQRAEEVRDVAEIARRRLAFLAHRIERELPE